jgi:hypothetical protein
MDQSEFNLVCGTEEVSGFIAFVHEEELELMAKV